MHLATTASKHQDNSHLKPSWNHLPVPQNMEQGILAPRDGIRPIELCSGGCKTLQGPCEAVVHCSVLEELFWFHLCGFILLCWFFFLC